MKALQLKEVTYLYPGETKKALDEVNLTVLQGEFILILGPSGCGKSTLIRAMNGLVPQFYGGTIGGQILYLDQEVYTYPKHQLLGEIGMVFQDPEKQMVMNTVEREVAFGLENLGIAPKEMKKRVMEVLSYLGLLPLRHRELHTLSGGEKQKTALAAALVMKPTVLLLDEPTSQLDPTAAEELLHILHQVNQEVGITIVLLEQRMDRCFVSADRIIYMEEGRISRDTIPREFVQWAAQKRTAWMPPVAKLFKDQEIDSLPLTVKEGREKLIGKTIPTITRSPCTAPSTTPVLRLTEVSFGYPKYPLALDKTSIQCTQGEFICVLGANGAGKSTLLKLMAGLIKPVGGKIELLGQVLSRYHPQEVPKIVGYLGQNPGHYLFHDTLEEEWAYTLALLGITSRTSIQDIGALLHLQHRMQHNPRDLSGGERQRAALGSILVVDPQILLLDEPTRGIDPILKIELGDFLQKQQQQGKTILMVTHDIEFAATYSQRIILLIDGMVVADGLKEEVLDGGLFYSPQVNKVFYGITSGVVTVEQGVALLDTMKEVGG